MQYNDKFLLAYMHLIVSELMCIVCVRAQVCLYLFVHVFVFAGTEARKDM